MERSGRAGILCDGGIEGLVACAAACERNGGEGAVAIFVKSGRSGEDLRRRAVDAQASALGLGVIDVVCAVDTLAGDGERETLEVLRAAYGAAGAGCDELIWPVQVGAGEGQWPDLDALAERVDRALLLGRLVSLDAGAHGRPGFRVLTPFVDFTDRQMADLMTDLGANAELCWWWGEPETHAQAWAERVRWMEALRQFGWVGA
jgi:hypothetical protein